MRRRPNVLAAASAIVALLLQLVVLATAAHARPVVRAAELTRDAAVDATLAPPVKRNTDVVRPERLLRVPGDRPMALCQRLAASAAAALAAPAYVVAPPRARSHAQRLRVRSSDDPPQPASA